MPRPRGVPSYCLHRPSGQARVRIDGKDHYLGPYGSPESKAEYERLVRRTLADRTRDELVRNVERATDITVAEIVVRYTAHVESYYVKNGRPTGQVTIIKLAIRVARLKFGDLEAREFGPRALKACRDAFVAQGLCRAEVNRRTALVRQLFKWAVEEELIPPSVWHGLKAVSGLRKHRSEAPDRGPVGPAPESVVDAILPRLPRPVAAMVRLQLLAGMRPEEVVTMRGCDLVTSGPVWEYHPDSHKTEHLGKGRVIMLGPRAQAIVKEWLRTDLEAFLFSPRQATDENLAARRRARRTPLWASHEAEIERKREERKREERPARRPRDRYDVASYRRAIHRGCDRAFPHPELSRVADRNLTDDQKAELEAWRKAHRFSPNRLRHSAATRLRREIGLDAARVVLGHSDAATTTIYAERDMDAARLAMERLG